MKPIKIALKICVSFIVLIALWQIGCWCGRAFGDYSEALLPGPGRVFKTLVESFRDGTMPRHIGASLYRFVVGYFSAVVVATLLGLILGVLPRVFEYVNPIAQLLRPISPMAWAPFIVLLGGIGDRPAIVVVFIAAFFPILLTTVAAVGNIDPIYFKVARNFGVGRPSILWKIVFPAAFPQIANGFHLALGTAWVFLAAGEMNGVQSGLGFLVTDSRNLLRADLLLATIVTIGALGLTLDGALRIVERAVLRNRGRGEE